MARPRGKLSKGQPRGSRSASGRKRVLVGEREATRVKPCDGVLRRYELYGVPANDTGTCTAIGRANAAGLLGVGERAERMVHAAERLARQYQKVRAIKDPRDSLARFMPQTAAAIDDPVRDRIVQDAFNDAMELVKDRGPAVALAFVSLVLDRNPDDGPAWLDRLVLSQATGVPARANDLRTLGAAIEGLEAVL